MSRKPVDSRKSAIYKHWLESGNMAETGRVFGVSRQRVDQVIREMTVKVKSVSHAKL